MMTYSILGYDVDSGEIGLASTTVSLAVGGLIPFFSETGAVVVSQAYALPSLGSVMVDRLNSGANLSEAIEAARASDLYFEYRQVAILTPKGQIAAHSGTKCRPWTGHLQSKDYLVFGNVLSGEEVLNAMAVEFEKKHGEILAERLICALEAGREAGGQAANGKHLRERSASVIVKKSLHETTADLRVDVSENAVEDLRRAKLAVDLSEPYVSTRARDPENCPSVVEFERSIQLPRWFPSAVDPIA